MAVTAKYIDLSTLAHSSIFADRITVAVAAYAQMIITEDPTIILHASRLAWARSAAFSPVATAAQILYLCALDPAYSGQKAVPIDPNSIDDATLDKVVQTVINTTALKF